MTTLTFLPLLTALLPPLPPACHSVRAFLLPVLLERAVEIGGRLDDIRCTFDSAGALRRVTYRVSK